MPKIRVALLQMKVSSDPDANLRRVAARAEAALKRGARILCLQELFRTPYFCQEEKTRFFKLAETVPGPATEAFQGLAKHYRAVIVVPVFEKRAAGVTHNAAAVLGPDGRILGTYRKMHLPDDPHYYEKFYFSPGDLGFPVFRTELGCFGILICWDQWYPEAARCLALRGAEIILIPTAIGSFTNDSRRVRETQRSAWRTIQVSHAIANGCFVACANRTGREQKIRFWGSSFIAAPTGKVLTEAGAGEEVVTADCDLGEVRRVREEWPFLRDRRIDAYRPLLKRFVR